MCAKVIKKKLKLKNDDGSVVDENKISEIFNQMLGEGKPELKIIYPKFIDLTTKIKYVLGLINIISSMPSLNAVYKRYMDHLKEFVTFCNKEWADKWNFTMPEHEWKMKLIDEETETMFASLYKSVKESNVVRTILMICDKLIQHKNALDSETAGHIWILGMSTISFEPFPFSGFDLRSVYIDTSIDDDTKQFLTKIMYKILTSSHSVYKLVTAPDIDMDEFVGVLAMSMKQVKKTPELHRCNKAFDKIEASLDKLKDNFGDYYRDFLGTRNPTIMMEHFVLDVAKDSKDTDPELAQQFRKIVAYYQNAAKQRSVNDPQLKLLFERVNSNLGDVDKATSNIRAYDKST
jgi:hypothetical protein